MPALVDLTGLTFDRLRVIRRYPTDKKGAYWLCLCDPGLSGCSNEAVVLGDVLRAKRQRSCGCLRAETTAVRNSEGVIDETGNTYGYLTVISQAASKGNFAAWNCRCKCGRETVVRGVPLRRGKIVSCGCLRGEDPVTRKPEYGIWIDIKTRCFNPDSWSYRDYGSRGIRMCAEWQDSFEAFLRDMGPRPSAEHSIERENVNGHYEPSNCRWATRAEQGANKRNNVWVTYRGERMILAEAAKRSGIKDATLRARHYRGLSGTELFSRNGSPEDQRREWS
jgi:hypothetical protein